MLITGASRGLGRALAVELTRRGHTVIATARDPADLEDLDVAGKLELDVTDAGSVEAAVGAAGEVEVLVNNAAITVQAPVEAVPIEIARSVLETNVLGPLRLMQAVLPGMRERGRGRVVNVSSGAVRSAPPLQGVYAAAKAALELISQTVAKELDPFGIRMTVAAAGGIKTEMRARQGRYVSAPYRDLVEQTEERMRDYEQRGGGAPAAQIAAEVADLIEQPDPPARAEVG